MRTTIDLPPDLLKAAKAMAAERGENLKVLFARAVEHEIEFSADSRVATSDVLPLIGNGNASVDLANADIETALSSADAEYCLSQ